MEYFQQVLEQYYRLHPICLGATGLVTQLKEELLCNYDKGVRPVLNHTDITFVVVLLLIRYIDFKDFDNSLQVHMFSVLSWDDIHLKWDRQKYNGLSFITIDADDIWVPDIVLTNSGDFAQQFSMTSTSCLLLNRGAISCVMPKILEGYCNPDFRYWPFDTQTCELVFTSWSHSSDAITLIAHGNGVYMENLVHNNVWQLLNVTSVTKQDNFENDSYSTFVVTFTVKRNSPQHVVLIYIPGLVLALMTLVTFWLPPDGPDRFTVCCADILCNALALLHVYISRPGNADNTMFIVLYYRDSFIMAMIALLLTIAEQRFIRKSSLPPVWIFAITNLIVKTKIGQILMFNEITLKGAAEVSAEGEEEGAGLIEMSAPAEGRGWHIAMVLIDRVAFIVYLVTFVILMTSLFP